MDYQNVLGRPILNNFHDFYLKKGQSIKRLDVPSWIITERIYYTRLQRTRRPMKENETFDDYESRRIEELGYTKIDIMLHNNDGYFLIDKVQVFIQYNGRVYWSTDKNKVNIFKQELKKYIFPSITIQVFNALQCLIRNGLIKPNEDLYALYQHHLNNQIKVRARTKIMYKKHSRD